MLKKEGLIIGSEDFVKGIADSPYLGFEEMRNVDIEEEGIVRPNFATVKVSDSSGDDEFLGLSKKIVVNPTNGDLWTLADDQTVFFSTNDGANWGKLNTQPTSAGAGNGLEIWKDYLFVFGNTRIDVFGPLSGSPSWTNDWTSSALTSDTFFHPSVHAKDDKLYIGAGRYLVSLTENSGQTFAPGNSATYTLSEQALTLPSGERIRTINELGSFLILGTWIDVSTRGARLYPWNHFAQATSYETPIDLQEKGVRASVVEGNFIYVIAGDKGNLYLANAYEASILKKMPIGLLDLNTSTGLFDVYPGAIIYENGKIIFGSRQSSIIGVWSYNIKKDRLVYEYEISTGSNDGTTTIGALYPTIGSSGMLISWFDSTSGDYGLDQIGTNRFGAYKVVLKSPYYKVGTKDEPTTFNKLEIQLSETTASGDNIRIGYRTINSGSFTTLATLTTQGITSYSEPINLNNIQNLQLQIETGGNTTKILEIRLTKT